METARIRCRIKNTRIYADAFSSPLGTATGLGQAHDAAGTGRRASTWRVSYAGPNSALSYAQPTLIARSRDAVRKNPLAESAVATIETNVVGCGIKPQFITPDAGLNKELGELWALWTDEADADGRGDFYAQQALATRGMVEAGEVFGRLRNRLPGDMDTVALQVQLLESEFCRIDKWTPPSTPLGRVVNGVEFNAFGQRIAYWMYRQHPNDWDIAQAVDLNPVRVPASEVMHVYSTRRPGQIRGEPWLTRALIKLRDLDAYDDAELMRKKTAALFAGFIERPDPDGAFMGEADDTDADGIVTAGLQPGTMQILQPGEHVEFAAPADVGGNYETFMREQKRGLAVATGILFEQLTGDYSQVDDRTFRASVNEFRRRAQMWQHHLVVFNFCRPVARRWLDTAITAGPITLPRGMEDRDLYRIKWVPEGWPYIHPVQEVQAAREAVLAGFKSRAQVVSEAGYDVETIDEEIAADNARADQLELVFTSDGRKGSNASNGSGSGSVGPSDGSSSDSMAGDSKDA